MFLLVPAYPGCPGQTAVKWLLLLLLLITGNFSEHLILPAIDLEELILTYCLPFILYATETMALTIVGLIQVCYIFLDKIKKLLTCHTPITTNRCHQQLKKFFFSPRH